MSIIQVLVGFGLAAVLSLVLAEMNHNSSKQMGNMRLQFERAAIVQSLQSAISNPDVCKRFVGFNEKFGPSVSDNKPSNGVSSVKVRFFLDGNGLSFPGTLPIGNKAEIIADGSNLANYSVKVDWLRGETPTEIAMSGLPAGQKVYVTNLNLKVSPKANTSTNPKDKLMDLRDMDIGKVYFVTNGAIGTGNIIGCYGDAAGAVLCPNQNDIQVMSAGSWHCSSLSQALGPVCPAGQLLQSSGTATSCVQLYTTHGSCAGAGGTTLSPTCTSDQCGTATATSTSPRSYPVTINVPAMPITGGTFSGRNVVTGVNCSTSSGTGSMPGSTSCSESTVYIPALGAGYNATAATQVNTSVTIDVPSSSTSLRYKNCSGGCDQAAAVSCNNTKK